MPVTIADIRHLIDQRAPNSRLDTITHADVQRLKASHPGIPADYVEYLTSVGWGSIGPGLFMIYSGPIPPTDVFSASDARTLENYLLIGDDLAGWHLAFDQADWRVVSFDHVTFETINESKRFTKWLRRFLRGLTHK